MLGVFDVDDRAGVRVELEVEKTGLLASEIDQNGEAVLQKPRRDRQPSDR